MTELVCEIGNETHTAWCGPCRSVGSCLRLSVPASAEDRAKPRPLNPNLTPEQKAIVEDLAEWHRPRSKWVDQDDMTGSDAHQLMCHPRQLWALWRKGWTVRSMMDHDGRPAFCKWLLTDAAWAYMNRDSGSDRNGEDCEAS